MTTPDKSFCVAPDLPLFLQFPPTELQVDLTLVRVDLGLLAGLSEEMVVIAVSRGPMQTCAVRQRNRCFMGDSTGCFQRVNGEPYTT